MSPFAPLIPYDEHNRRLESNVHPPDWINPTPAGCYNLAVLGAGTAGLVAAAGAASLGAKVALVERELMGGDCLNVGCVPSKAVIRAGRAAAAVRSAGELGVHAAECVRVDFAAIMERMRKLRAGISPHDSAARFRDLGVDVFLGEGKFTAPDAVEVDGRRLRFRKALIATGGRASAPPLPGLDQVEYLTNETVFSLTEAPDRLAVIGAGPIGCELAQAFARFGSQVHLIEATHGILPREDPDASSIVQDSLVLDGVRLLCCGKGAQAAPDPEGVRIRLESHGRPYDLVVDRLLIAAGRAPNVEGLGLEAAGVRYDHREGVEVNDRLQTANPRIYAAGDVCSKYKFTHAADFMARAVLRNAFFFGRAKTSSLTIPWCTYTSPEIAHVGLHEKEAEEQGQPVDVLALPLADVDRAVLDGETSGMAKVILAKGTDRILGATIVAPHAGDMIAEMTFAITHKLGLAKIGETIHPYPTQAEVLRKLADAYNRTRLTPRVKWLFQKWFDWTR